MPKSLFTFLALALCLTGTTALSEGAAELGQANPLTLVIPVKAPVIDPNDPTASVSSWKLTYIPDANNSYDDVYFQAEGLDESGRSVLSMDGTFDLTREGVDLQNIQVEGLEQTPPQLDAYGIPLYGPNHIERQTEAIFTDYLNSK